MPEILLTFEWDGITVHKETSGFQGNECVSKTKWVEKALGTAGERKMKAEGYSDKRLKQKDRFSN